MDRILLLEDEAALRHSLCRVLEQGTDVTVREAGSLKRALALLDERPDLVRGNKAQAARVLGLSRHQLYVKLERLGILDG